MTRKTSRTIVKIAPVATTVILGIIWWMNGMEDTWLYITNALLVFIISWTAYPKKLEDEKE